MTIVVCKVSQSGYHGIPQAECQLVLFDNDRATMARTTNLDPLTSRLDVISGSIGWILRMGYFLQGHRHRIYPPLPPEV